MGILEKISIFSFFLLFAASSWAVLGEVATSGTNGPRENEFSRSARPAPVSSFFRVSQTTYSGGIVREYVNSQGIVFALSWIGIVPAKPEDYFGASLSKFQMARDKYAASEPKGFRKPQLVLQGDDFVHISFGHMGAVRGIVYIPSLLPVGVSVRDIK